MYDRLTLLVDNLSIQEVSLYAHLVEVLCFFIRQHSYRSKYFILSEGLAARVGQLMSCPEKHLKLSRFYSRRPPCVADMI
jgi:protein phosphatase-4 regulatory subunit 3